MLHHITSTCVALAASTIVVLNAQGAPIANAGASNAVTGLFRRDEFTQLSGTTREGVSRYISTDNAFAVEYDMTVEHIYQAGSCGRNWPETTVLHLPVLVPTVIYMGAQPDANEDMPNLSLNHLCGKEIVLKIGNVERTGTIAGSTGYAMMQSPGPEVFALPNLLIAQLAGLESDQGIFNITELIKDDQPLHFTIKA